jgi:signal transduction histidine kinase
MVHRPTPQLAAALIVPVPHYLLAAGILLAIALGVLTHQLRASYLRARSLAEGKEALEVSTEELRQLNEVLERRVEERTRELEAFTHSISHDLKSPLGAILNFAAILELDHREKLDPDGREMLERIRASAVRGTDLLEGLLRLSRAGHANLVISRIDMTGLARESFAQARQLDVGPAPELTLEPLPDARGDRALVQEVFVNLFDNALKYSRGREKRRVSVRGRSDGTWCVYEVEDNGQGFDMRYADKLFGLFERLHASREIEGTGVGLAMVARIVARHQGRVWADGRVGEGARFSFTLPAAPSSR